jgi:asparagine synthase (glutamine-hydrolysing)
VCGIAGIVDLQRATSPEALSASLAGMQAAIAHRGPDSAGQWLEANAGVALGHQRLAIIDLSPRGHQPMHSASGRYTIVFNGEVFNFRRLRERLEREQGTRFRGGSDTEVMLAAVEGWGLERAVGEFIGMFAFALWDSVERRLHLVRDRLGVKPLCHARIGDTFLFGSEIKALEAHPGFVRDIDPAAVASLVRLAYVPAPLSIYRDARKQAPATIVTLDATTGTVRTSAYWSLADVIDRQPPFAGSEAEAADALEALLRDAVRIRLISDVPLGVLLSGGVDSSAVAALAHQESGAGVRTFSIGFSDPRFDESVHAREVAKAIGTQHTEMIVNEQDALDEVPGIASRYDEPFADPSQLPTYLVCKLARRDVTVCLSGDGGDEVFGGYNRYLWAERLFRRSRHLPAVARRLAAAALGAIGPAKWERVFAALAPALPAPLRLRDPGDKVEKMRKVLAARDAGDMYRSLTENLPAGGRSPAQRGMPAATLAHHPEHWPASRSLTEKLMYVDTLTYMPDDVLAKVDRASMAVALETREPLLDHRLVEVAWSMPLAYRVHGGVTKRLLRTVLYRHVPRALIERPKWGFAAPIAAWLRGPLRPWAEELLEPQRLDASGLDAPTVREMWTEHLAGRRNHHAALWPVLMLEAWRLQSRPRTQAVAPPAAARVAP